MYVSGNPPRAEGQLGRARFGASLLFFLDGAIFAAWVTRIPAVQERMGLGNSALGIVLLMVSLGALVTMPLIGRAIVGRSSGGIAVAAVTAFAVALILPAIAPGIVTLSAALFLFGGGFGAVNVSANAHAATVERAYGRPIMASFHAFFSFGGIVGGLLGSGAAAMKMTPLAHFVVMAVIAVAAAQWARGWLIADAPAAIEPLGHLEVIPKSRAMIFLGLIAFCSMFGEGAMADWSAVYLRQVSLAAPATAALGFAAFSFSMTFGRLICDRVTLAIGPVRVVRLGGTLAAAGVAFAMVFPGSATAIAGFGLVGLGLSSLVPTIFSAAARCPGIAPSVGIAAVSTTGYFGFLSGPPLIGFVSALLSLRGAIGFVILAGGVAIVLAKHVAPRSRASIGTAFEPAGAISTA